MNTISQKSILFSEKYNYVDVYSQKINSKNSFTAEELGKAFFQSDIPWIEKLFALRNRIVSFLGLKISGSKEEVLEKVEKSTFEIGEKFGLFKVFAKQENELVLGEVDKHLDFKVSLLYSELESKIFVSTFVKFNNFFGKFYFFFVKPFHKIIVQVIVKNMVKNLEKN